MYYFTDSYPYSNDYTWKTSEVHAASDVFDEVIIVPFTFKKSATISFPSNVTIEKPTINKAPFAKLKYLSHLFSRTQPYFWALEVLKAFFNGKSSFIDWYIATVVANKISRCRVFSDLRSRDDKDEVILFFQWTMNNALLVPKLRAWGYERIVCRMHGFDLYEFRHNNYVPYKKSILKGASHCTFISKHGLNYAVQRYPFIEEKSQVGYLGSKSYDSSIDKKKNTFFHLISVSRVVPLKRLHLIAKSLSLLDFNIKWTHLGDGYYMDELQMSIKSLSYSSNVEMNFLGWLNPLEIERFFNVTSIDGFVLVSETEGLPVSIMEAMSASIPVIATDVGGVSEIVNSSNGILLKSNPTEADIANAITFLKNECPERVSSRRQSARDTYELQFNLKDNSHKFVNFLRDLV